MQATHRLGRVAGHGNWVYFKVLFHRSDKAVSPPRQGFHVTRAGGGVSQCFTDLVHSRIQAVIEIDERIGGPELLAKVLPRDHLRGTFQEKRQHLKWLLL